IVNPDNVIDRYGADAFRCYEMFMGPLQQMKPWSMRGVEGVSRFLARVWRLFMTENQSGDWELSAKIKEIDANKTEQKMTHATIKKVTEDIESLSFNTAISQMPIVATDEEMKTAALSNPKIQERIAGKTVDNVIVVPKKLVNIVVD